MSKENQVNITWHNLNFYVPLTREDKLHIMSQKTTAVDEDLSEPLQDCAPAYTNISMKNGVQMKQVITNAKGYAKPGEIMAIMGPSGSGKTSLLNSFAQRLASSPGCILEGVVRSNNRPLTSNDFGKIGAFV